MPGRVVKLLVAAGDTVTAGQPLCVVEAMKMQNELTAPAAGVVRSVRVQAGEQVAAGAILLQLD
jgi:biotin carboxyl carrier protein